jgi:hypothetical protein
LSISAQYRFLWLGLASLLWADGAIAQGDRPSRAEPDASLLLDAPADEGCGSALDLRAEVTKRVGVPLFTEPERASRNLLARVSHGPSGYRAALLVLDAEGSVTAQRLLDEPAARCDDLMRALSVVLATFFGVRAGEQGGAAESAVQRAAAAPPSPGAAAPAPAPRETRPRLLQERFVSLGVLMGRGFLPGPAPALTGAFSAAYGAWSASLGPLLFPRVQMALGAGASARFSAWLLRAQLCVTLSNLPRLGLSACTGGRAGLVVSESAGLAQTRRARMFAGEVETGLQLTSKPHWLGGRTGLYGGLGASLPLQPPHFVLTEASGMGREYHRAIWGMWAELGFVFRVGS